MRKFLESLKFIFMPSYWIMLDIYSKEVDNYINRLLDKYDFTEIDRHTAKLGNELIWVENAPYGAIRIFGYYQYNRPMQGFRPSRLTVYKALKKLEKDREKTFKKQWEGLS